MNYLIYKIDKEGGIVFNIQNESYRHRERNIEHKLPKTFDKNKINYKHKYCNATQHG